MTKREHNSALGDCDIRDPFRKWLVSCGIDPTVIVDEVFLCGGESRADIAVFQDSLTGFEIKSAKDSLVRFASQAGCYNRCFEFATLVADPEHIASALPFVQDWWGL